MLSDYADELSDSHYYASAVLPPECRYAALSSYAARL